LKQKEEMPIHWASKTGLSQFTSPLSFRLSNQREFLDIYSISACHSEVEWLLAKFGNLNTLIENISKTAIKVGGH